MADDATVKFGADIRGLLDGIEKINDSINVLKRTVEGLTGQFLRSFEGELLKFLSVDAIGRFIGSMTELGEHTKRTAEIFGITTEQVAQLDLIAKATGTSGEALTHIIARLSMVLNETAGRATPAAAALHALGLSASDFKNLGLFEVIDKLRVAWQKLPEGLGRTAVAQALVRNGAQTLIPILDLTNKEWNDLLTASKNTGAEMSQRTANAFAATGVRVDILQQSILGLGIKLFNVLRPALDAAIDGITRFVQSLNPEKLRGIIVSIVQFAANAIITVGDFVIEVQGMIDGLVARVKGLPSEITSARSAVEGIVQGAVGDDFNFFGFKHGEISKAVGDVLFGPYKQVNAQLDGVIAQTAQRKKDFEALINGLKQDVEGFINPGGGGGPFAGRPDGPSGGTGSAPSLDIGMLSKIQQFQQTLRGAMEAARGIDVLRQSMTMGAYESAFFTTQQKLLSQAVVAGIPITKTLKTAIDAVATATAQATVRMQHFQQVQDALQQLAQGITGAFMSWIHGTKSLGQAFLELAVQIAEAVIQALILDAIMAALGLALPTAGLGGLFSGLFGGGAVGAPMNIIPPGFATGAWEIPNDMLAMVHKGEMVVPAAQAQQMRGGGFGGGVTFAPVIQALDASGVDRVLQKHGKLFAQTIAAQFNHNPSIRPKF